jgi:signal transduction histidine kinase
MRADGETGVQQTRIQLPVSSYLPFSSHRASAPIIHAMNSIVVLALISALVAVCAAALHGWLFVLRPRDRSNLWLTVTAAGVAGMSVCSARLYLSQDIEESVQLQALAFLTAGPILFGLYRYSFIFLEIDSPWASRMVAAVSLSLILCGLFPAIVLSGTPVQMEIELVGARWVQSGLTPPGQAYAALMPPVSFYLMLLYWRIVPLDDPNRITLMVMVTLWVLTFVNDVLVATDVYQAPILLAMGYGLFLIGLSSIQIRKLVDSMVAVERSTEKLHELVDQRTSELREAELQLAHGAQMATIGALAASLAHEINNPIAYVSSNLNRLGESWEEPGDQGEVDEMLVECQEGIGRVRTIASSLLSLARKSDGVDQPVDLHPLIDSALAVVRREARYRAQLELDLEPIPKVSGDPRLLGHVVLTLVMNAVRTIPEGAPEQNRIHIETRSSDDEVVLQVSDTGDVDACESRPGEKSGVLDDALHGGADGLGLAITRQIVERHHGRISTDRGPTGTVTTVRLPAHGLPAH